jgi:enediyne biosynthesis protein E4
MNRRGFLFSLLAQSSFRGLAQPPAALPQFRDITAASGVRFKNEASHTPEKYLLESMTGGVALLDYDGDGWLDLFFVNGALLKNPMGPDDKPDKSDPKYWNRLYRNNRDGAFTDVTEKAGVRGHSYGMGAAVGDYDNDGRPDLYVTNFGRNILYHNNGDGTFTDVTEKAGVAGGGWSVSACFVDFDRDGRLDLIVTRYLDWDFSRNPYCGERKAGYRAYCHPDQFKAVTHLVYRNNGDGTFTDVSAKSGVAAAPGKGLGIAINDFDRDGWPDLFIANDSFPQQLFRNKRDGTFEEIGLIQGVAYDDDGHAFAGMGADFQDYDNDGWPDVFVNALANQRYGLFRNVSGAFEYVSGPSQVAALTQQHSGWGAKFADFDNDGWKDLFVGQGHVMDNIELTQPSLKYLEPPLLLRNTGNGKFVDISARSGDIFRTPLAARGAAFGDLNNDGFLDVAINCNDRPAVILRNEGGNGNHWLMLDLVGTASNRDGIGAKIRVVSESGLVQHAMVSRAGSYLSSNDKRAHFGLGSAKRAALVEIAWPSGTLQKLKDVAADRIVKVEEPRT